jgi:hypothetical protein
VECKFRKWVLVTFRLNILFVLTFLHICDAGKGIIYFVILPFFALLTEVLTALLTMAQVFGL